MNKLKYYIDWAVSTWFGLLYTPSKYSKEWDEKLNQILDTGDFKFDEYVMYFKNYEVWVCVVVSMLMVIYYQKVVFG